MDITDISLNFSFVNVGFTSSNYFKCILGLCVCLLVCYWITCSLNGRIQPYSSLVLHFSFSGGL